MPRYSPERKAALLKKLFPPLNLSVAVVARHEGISEVTLYAWRKQAKAEGAVVPGDKKLQMTGQPKPSSLWCWKPPPCRRSN